MIPKKRKEGEGMWSQFMHGPHGGLGAWLPYKKLGILCQIFVGHWDNSVSKFSSEIITWSPPPEVFLILKST